MDFEDTLELLEQDAIMALYGYYDAIGVRKWFHRKNSHLESLTPYEVLMTTRGYRSNSMMSEDLRINAVERVEEAALQLNALKCEWLRIFE